MKLTVTYEGEPFEVNTKGIDTVTAERKYHGLKEANAAEAGYFMAWNVCKREGKTDLAFDEWLLHVDDVEETPDPTESESSKES